MDFSIMYMQEEPIMVLILLISLARSEKKSGHTQSRRDRGLVGIRRQNRKSRNPLKLGPR
jgi:hypothetical protein